VLTHHTFTRFVACFFTTHTNTELISLKNNLEVKYPTRQKETLEGIQLVSNAIIALPPANVDLLV
jgi:hypothetical protein